MEKFINYNFDIDLEAPLLLLHPGDRYRWRVCALGETDPELERFSGEFFSHLQIKDPTFENTPFGKETFLRCWCGASTEFHYRVSRGTQAFPFWVWLACLGTSANNDKLVQHAHSLAEQFLKIGWKCAVKSYWFARENA